MKATQEQEAVILSKRPKILAIAGPGCHQAGQGILLHDGSIKSVETIRVGDNLLGPDSKPRRVLRLITGWSDMVEVRPVKGRTWTVNLDHVLTVRLSSKRYERIGLTDVTVREWLNWSQRRKLRSKLERVGVEFSANAALPIDPYFLGVILGDGCIGPSVSVSKPGKFIESLCAEEAAKWGLKLRRHLRAPNNPTYVLSSGSAKGRPRHGRNRLLDALRELGLFNVRGASKFIPQCYKCADLTSRSALLAGLIDTDGHVAHGNCDFVSVSQRLAEDVAFVSRSLGLAAYVSETTKSCQTGASGQYWRISISGDLSSIPLRRIAGQPRRQIKNHLRTGFTVHSAGTGEFFGFMLDGDGRYLLDDFTITHNSGKTFTVIQRIDRLLALGFAPASFLIVTLTNAAARELQARLPTITFGYCGTLHGFLWRLIQGHYQKVGLPRELAVIDEEQTAELLEQAAVEMAWKGTLNEIHAVLKAGVSSERKSKAEIVVLAFQQKLRQEGLLTYDMILEYGLKIVEKVTLPYRFLFVDEYHDSGDMDEAVYRALTTENKFFVGDADQCQPGDTEVETDNGWCKISALRVGMKIKSWDRNACRITSGHRVTAIQRRTFHGKLNIVKAGAHATRCTDNHRWLVRWTDRTVKVCVTYLMFRKGFGWRVGWCQLFNHHVAGKSHGLHFFIRCNLEKADTGFILGVHQKRADASVEESILSIRYGIPTVQFEPMRGAGHYTKENIARIFAEATPDIAGCLNQFGRSAGCPFYIRDGKRKRTTYLELQACNLLYGLHSIPTRDGNWYPVQLSRGQYDGDVFSLDVETTHSYVADSLCTLNSIYGFRGGNVAHIIGAAAGTSDYWSGAEVCFLEGNFRCAQVICDTAQRLIAHNPLRVKKKTWSMTGAIGNVVLSSYRNDQEEMNGVAEKIRTSIENKVVSVNDVAVLLRTNRLADAFAKRLKTCGVMVRPRKGNSRPKDWRQAMNYLALLNNPDNDRLAWLALREWQGKEKADSIRLEALRAFQSINDRALHLPHHIPLPMALGLLEKMGVSVETRTILNGYAGLLGPKATVPDLLLTVNSEQLRPEGDGVTVTTMHSAKGTEFTEVYLPAFEEGIIPIKSAVDACEVAEERRLAYVGITRAKLRIAISWAERRTGEWDREPREQRPSRFIGEMGLK